MTRYTVAELEGELLDAAVAKAEGYTPVSDGWKDQTGDRIRYFKPSKWWDDGGPIIERERITVQASQAGDWRAFLGDGTTNAGTGRGAREPMVSERADAPLIAAMRAYVASKFGEEVELPD